MVRTTGVARTLVVAVLLAAAGACGGVGGLEGGDGGGDGGGGSGGGRRNGPAVAILPTSSYDPGPDGGANLPEPTFLVVVRECYAGLRAGSFEALATRMTSVMESAEPEGRRGVVVAARLCRGLASLNEGELLEATRDLDSAEGGLGALPGDPKHQLELLLLRGQMVASAELGRPERADAYLDRAATLAPEQAGRFERELAAASGTPGTTATTAGETTVPETTAGEPGTTATGSGGPSAPSSAPATTSAIG